MIEKIKVYEETPSGYKHPENKIQDKINELIDAVNELQLAKDVMFNRIDMLNNAICDIQNRITALDDPTYHEAEATPADNSEKANCQENVQPYYVTTTYVTDGKTKEYYGQNGASIATDYPLPAGYIIAINEPETKGGNNE